MKTPAKTFIITIAILLLLAIGPLSALGIAENRYISLSFITGSASYSLSVIEDNLFYTKDLFQGIKPSQADYQVSFLDSTGSILSSALVYLAENNYYPFNSQISRIRLEKNGALVSEKQVSFCNLDGVCESCSGAGCTLVESSLSCADCPTGGSDNACDLVNDGICDPDCEGKDRDCPGCTGDCWYRDSTMQTTSCASDKKGIGCKAGQLCTGKYVYADDTGSLCCTGGKCLDSTVVVTPNPPGKIVDGSDLPVPPTDSAPPSEPAQAGQSLWLIPVIAAIALAILAYVMLRKPKAQR